MRNVCEREREEEGEKRRKRQSLAIEDFSCSSNPIKKREKKYKKKNWDQYFENNESVETGERIDTTRTTGKIMN